MAGRYSWGLDVLPFALVSILLLWMTCRKPPLENSASIIVDPPSHAPAPPAAGEAGYTSMAERELAQRQGPGLPGLITESSEAIINKAKGDGVNQPTRKERGPHKFNGMIEAELQRLTKITRRYYKNEPAVREVDKAFGSLPRYMSVKKRYQQDHDAYAFAHDTMALPEVRKTIHKYALDPNIWRVTMGMMQEGLKEKPPKPLYDEMKRFFTQDKEVLEFATELSGSILPNIGKLMPQALKSGQDLKPLQDLAKDLNLGAPPAAGSGEIKLGQNRKQLEQQAKDFGKGSKPTR